MRKKLLITVTATLLVFLLASCSETKYRYEVRYEKCDGSTWSVSYEGNEDEQPEALGRFGKFTWQVRVKQWIFTNVCSVQYERKEAQ